MVYYLEVAELGGGPAPTVWRQSAQELDQHKVKGQDIQCIQECSVKRGHTFRSKT